MSALISAARWVTLWISRLAVLPAWLQALIPGGLGVAMARAHYFLHPPAEAYVIYAGVTAVLFLLASSGQLAVKTRPVLAARLMGLFILPLWLLSAAGTFLVVFIAVQAAPPKAAEPQVTEVLTATAAVLTAAVTAALIKLGEGADGWIGARVRSAFRKDLGTVFAAESEASKAIADDVWREWRDWSWPAREARAAVATTSLPPIGA